MTEPDYSSAYISGLFQEMARTYGLVNLITSFGFAVRWRRQCLAAITLPNNPIVVDLMSGMGELGTRLPRSAAITGIDFCPAMCEKARQNLPRATILECDALRSPLPENCADAVVSSFGLKTLAPDDFPRFAREVHRILKPGGAFSFLEISVPRHSMLKVPYMFYLHRVIPFLGRLMLGNPDNYRMLGLYTEAFQNCSRAAAAFAEAGLELTPSSFFFGCASGFHGRKPS